MSIHVDNVCFHGEVRKIMWIPLLTWSYELEIGMHSLVFPVHSLSVWESIFQCILTKALTKLVTDDILIFLRKKKKCHNSHLLHL